MNVLVINCGSSSLKFQLINSESEEVLAKGLCERIGIDGSLTYQPAGGEKVKSAKDMPTHTEPIQFVIDALTDPQTGVVKRLDEIGAVGHRVVHGGEKFASSVVITEEVKKVESAKIGVKTCKKIIEDTGGSFHAMEEEKIYTTEILIPILSEAETQIAIAEQEEEEAAEAEAKAEAEEEETAEVKAESETGQKAGDPADGASGGPSAGPGEAGDSAGSPEEPKLRPTPGVGTVIKS